jgi:hypothetical protein
MNLWRGWRTFFTKDADKTDDTPLYDGYAHAWGVLTFNQRYVTPGPNLYRRKGFILSAGRYGLVFVKEW